VGCQLWLCAKTERREAALHREAVLGREVESVSSHLVDFYVLNDNLIKGLILFVGI
jgi:hypothetical protein